MKTKISIITVVYNAEKTIERTIQSVLEQDYPAIEYLIIDGKSTDNTCSIIQKYQQQIDVYISEPDKGLYDAMNKGLSLANGFYVYFLNAGDLLDNVHTISLIMQHTAAPVIYGDTLIIDQNWQPLKPRRLRPPKKLNYRHFMHGMLVSHQAFVAQLSMVPQFNLEYKYAADFDWCLQILKKARYTSNTGQTLAHFMDGGQTSRTRIPGLLERFRIMRKHFGLPSTLLAHVYIAFRGLWHVIARR